MDGCLNIINSDMRGKALLEMLLFSISVFVVHCTNIKRKLIYEFFSRSAISTFMNSMLQASISIVGRRRHCAKYCN